MKYLRLGLAWEYVLADLVGTWRQSLIEITGRDLLPDGGMLTVAWQHFGYGPDDVERARVLVESRLSSVPPMPGIVEPLARLSRAVERGDAEVYVFASGFPRMYKPVRLWLDAWGGKRLTLVCGDAAGIRYSAGNLGLDALIHTRASYPPVGAEPMCLLVDVPQFDQRAYPSHLVASLDAALSRVGFAG